MKRGTLDAWLQRKSEPKSAPLSSPASNQEAVCEISTPSTVSAASSIATDIEPSQQMQSAAEAPVTPVKPIERPATSVLSFSVVEKPKADYRGIPNEELGDLLYITDFVWTFRKLLRVPELSVPDLRAALQVSDCSAVLRRVLQALVREVVWELLTKAGEDGLAESLHRVRLMSKLKAHLDLAALCANAFLPLAQELLTWSLAHSDLEYAQPSDLLEKLQTSPLDTNFFSVYDYKGRTAVLVQLCDLVMESSSIHDVLGLRMEEKKSLGQKKAELTTQLRAFNKQHKGQQLAKNSQEGMQKAALKSEIAKLTGAIRAIPLRTEPLGYDRSENRYFHFGFDPTRLFVQRCITDQTPHEFWFCYQSRDLQRKLARAMNSKFECEVQLKEALEKSFLEEVDTVDEMDVEEEESKAPGKEEAVEKMAALEGKVTCFFESSSKCWETEELVQQWRTQVSSEESLEGLKLLLLDFAKKVNSPLKNCTNSAGLSRKGTIRLWNDYGEGLQDWLDVWSVCSSFPDLWLLISTLEAVFANYFQKKRSGVLSQKELEQQAPAAVAL